MRRILRFEAGRWSLAAVGAVGLFALADSARVQSAPAPAWTPQTSGVTARLRGVSAASDRVVWASGANGTVIRTEDGGETWTRLAIPGSDALDFRDVDAVDERTAYVLSIGASSASRIYKTMDAGKTWLLQFINEDSKAFYDAMSFWDATHGLAVSDSVGGQFVILKTDNGGGTWTRIGSGRLPPALPNEGAFAGSGTNIAVLPRGRAWIGTGAAATARVLRTMDYGASWAVADTPLTASASAGIFSLAFLDPSNGIAVGGDYKKESDATGSAAITSDGGLTWTAVKGLGGFRSAVVVVPRAARTLIAVGPTGGDISRNGGRTWTSVAGPGFHTFACAPSGQACWGAGESGRIGKLALR